MRHSSSIFIYSVFILSLVLLGCATVRDAREAQDALAGKAQDDQGAHKTVGLVDSASVVSYSLHDCVSFALTNRPSVVSARLAVEDARLRLKQIDANAPLFSATPWNAIGASVSGSYTGSGESSLKIKDAAHPLHGQGSAALSVDLLIYDFGRHEAEAKAQTERVLAAEQTLISESYSVFREVANAAFTCREKLLLVGAAEQNEEAYRLHLEKTEGLLEAGEGRKLDVLKARLDLANARESLLVASNRVRTAFAEFRHALGLPADVICPDADLKSVLTLETVRFDLEDPISLARTNAPSMRIARARLRAAIADVDKAVADLHPSISASASLSWTDPLWLVGLGVRATQSLFEGFAKTRAVDQAVVALQTASATVDETEQALMRDLELALATRTNAREARRSAEESLVSAEENLAVVTEQQKVGEASRIEFSDALNSVADARSCIIQAFCAELQSEAALFVLTGTVPNYIFEQEENK